MRAIILHWTNGIELPFERYLELLRTKEAAFGFATAVWVALISIVVHGGMFP
jgi:hypothetical protein